eukprot:gene11786-15769_t
MNFNPIQKSSSNDGDSDQQDLDEDYVYEDDEDGNDIIDDDDDDENENEYIQGKMDGNASNELNTANLDHLKQDSQQPILNKNHIKSNKNYIMLTIEDVSNSMRSLINEVSTLLAIHKDSANLLLKNNRWNKEKVVDSFFNASSDFEREKLLIDAGIHPNQNIINHTKHYSDGNDSIITCRICYDSFENIDLLNSKMYSLGCNHPFCQECFQEYLNIEIKSMNCISKCPEHKCNMIVTNSDYKQLLLKENMDLYHLIEIKNFIDSSKSLRYCPAPNCNKVAKASGSLTISCDCSYSFCFHCGESQHEPCSCLQLSKWTQKCFDDSENVNWMMVNTKKCPKCDTRIEKNQGCNHMTCRQCKYEFCWICFGPWIGHTNCNRFNPQSEEQLAEQSNVLRVKAEMERYAHYYKRFQGHEIGIKFAGKQRELADKIMMKEQQKKSASWIDVQFIKDTVEIIIDCRRVLKYTYVVGYYMPDATLEKQLFERHQEMLEENTERLHGYVEKSAIQCIQRAEVINMTRIIEKFRDSLLDHIVGGIVDKSNYL